MTRSIRRPRSNLGFSLGELVVAAAIGTVITTVVVAAVGRAIALRAAALPEIEATEAQTSIALDIRLAVTDAAAKVPYLDLAGMLSSVKKPHSSAAKPTDGGGVPTGGVASGTKEVDVIFRYGPPPRLRGIPIGPVTILEKPVVDGQTGDAIVVLRTDPNVGRLTLARDFNSSTNRMHLVARHGVTNGEVESLSPGDLLMVTGRGLAGDVVSCLALVTSKPSLDPRPESATSPVFDYYTLDVACGDGADYPWGLQDSEAFESIKEAQISSDASVAKLIAPRTYFVRDGSLWIVDGDPGVASAKIGTGDAQLPVARGIRSFEARAVLRDGTVVETVDGTDADEVRSLEVEMAISIEFADQPSRTESRLIAIEVASWSGELADSKASIYYAIQTSETDTGEPGDPNGPGEGFCLAEADDPATWPPGFDPNDSSSWSQVKWWDGFVKSDPSTWYYECNGGSDGGGK